MRRPWLTTRFERLDFHDLNTRLDLKDQIVMTLTLFGGPSRNDQSISNRYDIYLTIQNS